MPAVNLQPRYNIAPTTIIDVVIPRGGDRLELVPMRWGLIPSWWKKSAEEVPSTFNARAETVPQAHTISAKVATNRWDGLFTKVAKVFEPVRSPPGRR
jgi:putative SOS response-associated peptidase YedK